MEIVAGENSCYMILAFISPKIKMSLRHTKIGKVRLNLPLYKKITQLCWQCLKIYGDIFLKNLVMKRKNIMSTKLCLQ